MCPPPSDAPPADLPRVVRERLHAVALEAVSDLVVLLDRAGRIRAFNAAAERTTGYPRADVLDRVAWEVFLGRDAHASARVAHAGLLEGRPGGRRTLRWMDRDGHPVSIDFREVVLRDGAGTPEFVLRLGRAPREPGWTGREGARSSSTPGLGKVAAAAVHDLRSYLGAIHCYAELLSEDAGLPPAGAQHLTQLRRAAEHARALAQDLLGWTQGQEARRRALDPGGLLRGLAAMLRRLLGPDHRLELAVAPDLPAVLASRTEVERVVMNLVLNARAALPGGGTVALRVGREDADGGESGILLEVEDAGEGMEPDVAARAFEPFFSTRSGLASAGLGLAAVRWITEDLGGTVTLETRRGSGTTVRVWLPSASG